MTDTNTGAPMEGRVTKRAKSTRWGVIYGEKIAKTIITVGGLLVIVAVLGIMVFLFRVVAPMLAPGQEVGSLSYRVAEASDPAWLNADEFQSLATVVGRDGSLTTFHIATGETIRSGQFDFDGREVTGVGATLDRASVAFGFDDGTVRFGQVGFDVRSVPRSAIPADMRSLNGRDLEAGGQIYSQVQTGDYRTIIPVTDLGEAAQISDHAIVALDYRTGGTPERPTSAFVTVDATGIARVSTSTIRRNLMTGTEDVTTTTIELPPMNFDAGVSVSGALMASTGDRVFVSTDDGFIYRFDVRDPRNPVLAERFRAFADGIGISSMNFLNGELALVVGGTNGAVDVYFRLQPAGARGSDTFEMVRARSHAPQDGAVIDMSEAIRDKTLVTVADNGSVWVRYSTSEQTLFKFDRQSPAENSVIAMLFPRSDGVLMLDEAGNVDAWQYRNPHPEVSMRVIFGKLWYEGYGEPSYTWQSTSGTDLFEAKFSLVPLIAGTLKAAFYAMLFATPIAIMAAIYTSEFVHRGVRATVKPVMELMESLPTVVLGFLAALVLAPLVEDWIAAVLLGFIAVPMGLMIGAFVWQTLPPPLALRYDGIPKFLLMGVMIVLSCLFAYAVGPAFEAVLFNGDFKGWTNGEGSGTPFMFLLQLPLAYFVVSWGFHRVFGHVLRDRMRSLDKSAAGKLDALRWVAFLFGAMVLSYVVAALLTLIGFDPRGNIVDSYQQRNALVVGFVMAFAVIPAIYTLAEDALNAVPSHLRAGSLATGATPWQTAKWIVLPTAASGVFSAVMMGMGRAVGETMIVVMAAGNTPIMEWNIFSGLRTLSANIAIELPEAVKDGTNYRVLFLAALTLFLMTFVINTIAEVIRQRYRKRAFNL
ncbi:MAG: ABC transporter permease subunit [Paracoccaceae bacterium]